jgi:3'(2'), 5'-bisphosphate nucleotidase
MTDPGYSALRADVCAIAREAGAAIMKVYDSEFAIEHKDDRSPLTEADRQAHAIICDRLRMLTPEVPILSEESQPSEIGERKTWRRYWLVDPLDGTKEFIKRNGEFTVNIALIEGHRAVLGVVFAPAADREYSGGLGHGAFVVDGGPERPIAVQVPAQDPPRIVGSRSHASPALAAYLEAVGPHQLKSMGSSLKICLVAAGEADVYPRLGPTSEWDTAAAQAVLESAGGSMIDEAGQPLRYNLKEHLLNPYFLAFGDPERDWLAPLSRP